MVTRVVCSALVVTALLWSGCSRCKDGEAQKDGECVKACNADGDCGRDGRCEDGLCVDGARIAGGGGSSGVSGRSSSAAQASSSMSPSSSIVSTTSMMTANGSSASLPSSSSDDPDADHDGIPTPDDNCPAFPSLNLHDEDADGVGDVCDNCPGIPNADQANRGETDAFAQRDAVGDACDPRPSAPGDTIVSFETFADALSPSWHIAPNETDNPSMWTAVAGMLSIREPNHAAHRLFRSDLTGTNFSVETRLRIVAPCPEPSGANPSEYVQAGLMPVVFDDGSGEACMILAANLEGSNQSLLSPRIVSAGGSSSPLVEQPIAPRALGEWYTLRALRTDTALVCQSGSDSPAATVTPHAPAHPGLRTYCGDLDFEYFVVYGTEQSSGASSSSSAVPQSSSQQPSSSTASSMMGVSSSSSSASSTSIGPTPDDQVDGEQWYFPKGTVAGADYGFLAYVPQNYSTSPSVPLVLFLHGAGERGDGTTQLQNVANVAVPHLIFAGRHFPAVVISPQEASWWSSYTLDQFVSFLLTRYRIDVDRIYVTGLSMGGGGTVDYVRAHPERIAAAVPICPATDDTNSEVLHDIPMWFFHAYADDTVNFYGSTRNIVDRAWSHSGEQLVDGYVAVDGFGAAQNMTAVRHATFSANGVNTDWEWTNGLGSSTPAGNPQVTVLNLRSGTHNSWDTAYADQAMWDWLFAQRRKPASGLQVAVPSASPVLIHNNEMTRISLASDATSARGTLQRVFFDLGNLHAGSNVPSTRNTDLFSAFANVAPTTELGHRRIYALAVDADNNVAVSGREVAFIYPHLPAVAGAAQDEIRINFTDGSIVAGGAWNDLSLAPFLGLSYPHLQAWRPSSGGPVGTDVSLTITSPNWATGRRYHSPDADWPYPEQVMNSHYWAEGQARLQISGLDSTPYTIRVLGASDDTDGIPRILHVNATGGISATVNESANLSAEAVLSNVNPLPGGTIDLTFAVDASWPGTWRAWSVQSIVITR